MKVKFILTAVLFAVILISCGSINKIKMSSNSMINEIIRDYYKRNKSYINDYSVFHINKKEMKNQELEVYTIIPENDEIAFKVYLGDSINRHFPTNYLEYKNKLFLWREGNKKISDSVMQYIYNKKLVDSSYVKYQMGLITEDEIEHFIINMDDGLKGVTYVFCKSNPSKIKKRLISGNYIYPNYERLQVKCD
jgi:hypothetical protein